MKRFGKILGGAALLLVVLIVVLLVLAKVLITPERVKETVLPLAQDALQRDVELGDVEVSLFSGITLQNLVVHEKTGEAPFVAADQVVLRYQLLPLIFMRVVVDEVRLENPKIRVERYADGSFNFSDLTAAKEGAPTEVEPPAKPAEATGKGTGIDLLVSEVSIEGGELLFLDGGMGGKTPYQYELADLGASARDISLKKAFPFSVKGRLDDSPWNVDGEVNLEALQGKAKVIVADLDVTAFAPYFRDTLPGELESLKLNLDLAAQGGAQAVKSEGKIELKQIGLTLDALKDVPFRDSVLTIDYAVDADLSASNIDLEKAVINLNGIPVAFSGRVENYIENPRIDMDVKLDRLEISKAVSSVPPELVKGVKDLALAGTVAAGFHLAGSVQEPLKLMQEGELHLGKVQANVGDLRPEVNGTVFLKGDSATSEDLKVKIADNEADIDFKADNLFGKPIIVSSQVSARKFLLDPLLKTAAAPAAVKAPKTDVKRAEKLPPAETGPFDLPLKAEGTLDVGQTSYQSLNIDNLNVRYRLEKNVLTIDEIKGKLAGGTFHKTGKVDLGIKGFVYQTEIELQKIQAAPFIDAFFPAAAGTVFGSLNFHTQMNGSGTLPADIKRNLTGKGDFLLQNGKITGAGLVQGLADYLNLEELRVLRFSEAKGDFTVKNGQVELDSNFSGSDARMSPKGTVGLDGTLNVTLDAALSPQLTEKLDKKGKITQYFKDAQGWGQLPLKVAGTVGAPRFSIDTAAVEKQVKEKAKEKIQEKLEKKIFKELEGLVPESKEDEGVREPTKKLIDDALKGLFGN